jgi:hypothetical protein
MNSFLRRRKAGGRSLSLLDTPGFTVDTAFYADFMGLRNCVHGHVHVYAMGTRPCDHQAANALTTQPFSGN